MQLGDRLRAIRRDNLLTQKDIADELHVSRQTVSGWETGRSYPDITSLITLAETYHLSLDEMLREDEAATANLVKQDQQRREARTVYLSAFTVDIVLFLLAILHALRVPGFRFSPQVSLVLSAAILANLFSVGPSYRRYRLLTSKRVDRTMSLGNLALSIGLIVIVLILIYGVRGFCPEFLGALIGGLGGLGWSIVYRRLKYGPMRMTWNIW
jgi:transcriptional regulator with XRE-family HTH domain